MRNTLLLLGMLAIPAAASPQATPHPEILVLGSYHMANPGHDVHNMPADDVLSPRRQQDLAQLIEVLKRFHPTKIALEAAVGSQRVGQEYADYLAGKYTLSRNEIDQLGYRLAKELGHTTVYPVDEDGDFPYMRVRNYAKANGLADKFTALEASTGRRIQQLGEFLQGHSVLETLEFINADSTAARDVASYFDFVPFGEPYDYAGPDLLAAWYQRNIRIYRNIVALIDSPNEKILVLYGFGHLGWLRQDVANDANVRLRKLSDLTGRP